MSAGNCRVCNGDGEIAYGPGADQETLPGIEPYLADCWACDGTGKAGYVRAWRRILQVLRNFSWWFRS